MGRLGRAHSDPQERGAEGLEEGRAGDGMRHLRGGTPGAHRMEEKGQARKTPGHYSYCMTSRLLRTRCEASELKVDRKGTEGIFTNDRLGS